MDGNKRLGLATTFAFLVVNQRVLLCTNDEMVAFAVDLAASVPSMGWEEVAAWIVLNSSSVAELTERRLFEPGVGQVIAAVSEVTRLFHLEG